MIVNPILPGFHPDPSIVNADGQYVIATSTFEWFPGVRFHTSRDLVNWKAAGHALTDPDYLDLKGIPDSGGIWAPSLYWSDGRYTLVFTIVRTMSGDAKDLDNYVTTSTDLAGPWSTPVYIGSRGFDASLFHAPDGRLYLVGLRWDHRTNKPSFGGIQLQELDPETFDRRGAAKVIHTSQHPEVSEGLVEGPNMYHRNGWYYLMLAEGGTGWNHGIRMARSRNLWGPYEEDALPVLTTRDLDPLEVARSGVRGPSGGLHKAGHGELVETEDGEWYLVHLASRPVESAEGAVCVTGRETCLQQVQWTEDGWLRLTDGGHLPSLVVPAPSTSVEDPLPAAASAKAMLSEVVLGDDWLSLRSPVDGSWARWIPSSGRQKLELTGRESLRSVFNQSLVAHRVTGPSGTFHATIHAAPKEPFHRAGVCVYYDTVSHIFWYLSTNDHGKRIIGVERRDANGERDVALSIDADAAGPVHFKITLEGARIFAAVSLDGEIWEQLDDTVDAGFLSDDHERLLRFTGAFVGIAATDLAEHSWTASFDDVAYHYEK